MKIEGLETKISRDNKIIIDDDCSFKSSRLYVEGSGNIIELSKSLSYQNLFINIKGNNKIIKIENSIKNINNLKIVSIRGEYQEVYIGKNFSCGGCEIQMNDGNEKLSIGENCLFSWGIKIRTSDGHSVIDLATNKAINLPKDVVIEDHVWVGEDVKFLKGALIPKNCVVGSGAIVTKAFYHENSVIAGFPAKIVKSNVTWNRMMPYEYNAKHTIK